MAVFMVGSALCALADSLGVLIFGRVLQGAAGGVFPLAYGIIRDTFPEAGRMRAIGTLSVTLGRRRRVRARGGGGTSWTTRIPDDLLGPDHRGAAGSGRRWLVRPSAPYAPASVDRLARRLSSWRAGCQRCCVARDAG